MKQKITVDVTAIAEIIKKSKRWSNELRAEAFADYFERPETGKRIKVVLGKNTNPEFNREQFLKKILGGVN